MTVAEMKEHMVCPSQEGMNRRIYLGIRTNRSLPLAGGDESAFILADSRISVSAPRRRG